MVMVAIVILQHLLRRYHGYSLGAPYQVPAFVSTHIFPYIDGLAHDCSNSIALAMELLQYCAKPSIYESGSK